MSQNYPLGLINPTTTSPLVDITRLTDSIETLRTLFSGPSTPTETVPYMFWADTTEKILKRRSADDSTWVFALSLTDAFIREINTNYTVEVTDAGSMLLVNASSTDITIQLLTANAARAGSTITIKKTDNTVNLVNLMPAGTEKIDERSKYALHVKDEAITIRSTGEGWVIVGRYKPIVVITRNSSTTVGNEDDQAVYAIDAAGAARTVALPAVASVNNGFSLTVKKTDPSSNTITLTTNANETIDFSANLILTLQHQAVVVVADGTQWLIVSENNAPVPSTTFSSNATMVAGDALDVAASPGNLRYSEFVNQVSLRYNKLINGILASRGVLNVTTVNASTFTINYLHPYISTANYTAMVSGSGISDNITRVGLPQLSNYTASSVRVTCYAISVVGGALNQVAIGEIDFFASGRIVA